MSIPPSYKGNSEKTIDPTGYVDKTLLDVKKRLT